MQSIAFELGFGANVERLDNPCIHGSDNVHRHIYIFLSDAGLPCVRKAPLDSRLTVAHKGYRQTHKDLLALAQIGHCVGVAVELPKISALTHHVLLVSHNVLG